MSREQLIELAAGMREAADWIEANADLPVTLGATVTVLNARERDDLSRVARAFGAFEKVSDGALSEWYYIIRKRFGILNVECHTDRAKVCKKAKVLKEVDEWICEDSILAPELPANVS